VRLALYVCLKNICDGVGGQDESNGTPLDPPLFWLDNIFKTLLLRHSPCDDTPNAAMVAVTTCGVSLLSSKNVDFCFHTQHCGPRPLRYSTCHYSDGGGIGSIVTGTVATYQKSELASYLLALMSKSTAISKLSYSSYHYQEKKRNVLMCL
jgi:hypothetical protein